MSRRHSPDLRMRISAGRGFAPMAVLALLVTSWGALDGGTASQISVADDGERIPSEVSRRIFEPYVRAHERHGLTQSVGLGLAISQQLAELMNGHLTYQREGDLNVFRLELSVDHRPTAGSRQT